MTVQMQIQGIGIDQILELQQIEIGLCYRCREYDHFANECPNTVTDDSEGYESDRAALQLITAEAEMHNFDATRLNEEQDYLNL